MITAKVFCASKTEYGEGDDRHADLVFGADYADDRNKEWAKWTPALNVNMKVNGAAADLFEPSKRYTLQFVEEHEEREHPGTGVEMHGVELPADGAEHELSSDE